jgi:mannose-6-phosphate isomerase
MRYGPTVEPLRLAPNQLHRFYRGGARLAAFRGLPQGDDDRAPEDWVGSTTTAWGEDGVGLSRLADGRTLRDAIASDREAFLGPSKSDPGILVKLLDAGERLPAHLHPDDDFARRELGLPCGKTEAWLILEGGEVRLGWRDSIDRARLDDWVDRQNAEAMLAALNPVQVAPGDAVFVPAGVVHAIGAGVFMVEVQQPSDLSILLEWEGFAVDGRADGHLGLGFDRALAAASLEPTAAEQLVGETLPPEASEFFRAERVRGGDELGPAFSILVVVGGEGSIADVDVRKGDTLLLPYATGACRIEGDVEAIRCLAP